MCEWPSARTRRTSQQARTGVQRARRSIEHPRNAGPFEKQTAHRSEPFASVAYPSHWRCVSPALRGRRQAALIRRRSRLAGSLAPDRRTGPKSARSGQRDPNKESCVRRRRDRGVAGVTPLLAPSRPGQQPPDSCHNLDLFEGHRMDLCRHEAMLLRRRLFLDDLSSPLGQQPLHVIGGRALAAIAMA